LKRSYSTAAVGAVSRVDKYGHAVVSYAVWYYMAVVILAEIAAALWVVGMVRPLG
jgi:hypothetical protein